METWLTLTMFATVAAFLWLLLSRLSAAPSHAGEEAAARTEPCWTEGQRGDDGLRYGRSRCFNDQLAEMDARADASEFKTSHTA